MAKLNISNKGSCLGKGIASYTMKFKELTSRLHSLIKKIFLMAPGAKTKRMIKFKVVRQQTIVKLTKFEYFER